jgi:hypothetical protein
MKRGFIITLVICILALFTNNLFAQKHPEKHRKVVKTTKVHRTYHNKKVKVVKVHKYPRNKVVVVHQRRVRTVPVLPEGHATIVFKGRNYYYHGGYYYNYFGNTYTVIAPPIGIRIKIFELF